ncbi:PH domain-containing protein [Actinosynnema sp. NPDC047251]|uniref:Membrane-flanked domain-containing protein n=1 Tax=Saccharothrix espanaensis (strain ATCC 51144 / DSM 44229 / JCM 9112 / NBRC 15066 / NRRL 15764) TaxID=1179773 RepID=K0K4C2_SACES|nr:PH domain-containing protein [Saccharothrix espanaensis]CCH33141.1 membrane-flanked domain-containing protein [Saccharothrix espanaensis DSM 44229]
MTAGNSTSDTTSDATGPTADPTSEVTAEAAVDRADALEAGAGEPDPGPGSHPEIAWERLSVRMVWVNLVRLVLSIVPGVLATVVLNTPAGPVWPLLIASAIGVFATVLAFLRFLVTRYRVTGDRVERKSGWLVRQYRYVPRDRIRSVDSSVRLRHRLAGVRVVHIGSGESRSSFKLDALTIPTAEALRRQLMPDGADEPAPRPVAEEEPGQAAEQSAVEPEPGPPEEVLARFRKPWVLYEMFSVWAIFAFGAPVFGLYWTLQPFGVDLLEIVQGLVDYERRGFWWSLALCCAVAYPLGVVVLGLGFVMANWDFALVRTATKGRPALLTRRGLLSTRTVYRDETRIRGLHFKEPLLWRWLGLTRTSVVTTGLKGGSDENGAAGILPRVRLWEAREVAAKVLTGEPSPMEAPLARHPRGALTRRLIWATYGPAALAGVLFWLGATDALPDWAWWIGVALWPVALLAAAFAYLALGHALSGSYLVVRRGAFTRSTVALQNRAVIGWTLRQSIFQRMGRRVTVQIPTPAGERHYVLPDAGTRQALAFVAAATPDLASQFITPTGRAGERTRSR